MCTSVIVGRKAAADGLLIVARNEDFGQNNWNKHLKGMRRPQYASGENCADGMWRLGNGLSIPVPSHAYEYCGIADALGDTESVCAIGDHYYFEERGVNDKNVAISATNSMGINDKALAADPVVSPGIEEAVILTMLLPQASTAREAVRLLGEYVETYGASEANGVIMADESEAWYMEIGSAHHWIAVRVPEDAYLIVANSMRIRDVDLLDTQQVMASSGLFEFVVTHGLLDAPDERSFDFAGAFGYPGRSGDPINDPYYNVDRIWLAQRILTPSKKQQARMKVYPLFMAPDEKITVSRVAEVLRADYTGTELEGISTRPIGVTRTAESHIMVHDLGLPEALRWVIWQTIITPLGCPYMPVFAVLREIPVQYSVGGNEYDDQSAYWKFRSLFSLADHMGQDTSDEVRGMWERYEEALFQEHACLARTLTEVSHKHADILAETLARDYSTGILLRTLQAAADMRDRLLTRIAIEQA